MLASEITANYSKFVEGYNFDSLAVVVDFLNFAKGKDWVSAWAEWSPNHAEIMESYGGTNCVGLAQACLTFLGVLEGAGLMHSTKTSQSGNTIHHIAIRVPFDNPSTFIL